VTFQGDIEIRSPPLYEASSSAIKKWTDKRMVSLIGDYLVVFCYFELNIFYLLKILAIGIEHKL
jgi:hypothetical protein